MHPCDLQQQHIEYTQPNGVPNDHHSPNSRVCDVIYANTHIKALFMCVRVLYVVILRSIFFLLLIVLVLSVYHRGRRCHRHSHTQYRARTWLCQPLSKYKNARLCCAVCVACNHIKSAYDSFALAWRMAAGDTKKKWKVNIY